MRNPDELYDFKAIGQAIKKARESQGMTREQLGEIMDLAPRYIMSIENNGQHPSFQVFYKLATMFQISVDQYFFPETDPDKSTYRRQLEQLLDELEERDYKIMAATAKGIIEAKSTGTK